VDEPLRDPHPPEQGLTPSPSLWRNGAFLRVWTAATISIFGSLITRIALPLVAILTLGAGPIEVGILRAVELGAALVVGLVAGAWVDRLRRRPVLIWSDLGRAAILATVPLAAIGGWLTLPHLFVVAFLTAVLTTFFDSADNAYLPTIVPRHDLVRANGALAASGSAAESLAFGAGGFLVQVVTGPIAIGLNALTFLVSAALLGSIRATEAAPPTHEEREPVLREIRVGLSLVARDPVLRSLAGATMALAALWGIFGAAWILFAIRELGLNAVTIGLIAGVGGASSFAGAIVASRAIRRFGLGNVVIASMLFAAAGNLLIPLAPAGLVLVAVAFLVGQQTLGDGAVTVYDIAEVSVRQAIVPDRQLGRVNATFRVAMVLAQLVATVAAGVLAELFGLRAVLFLAPVGALVGAVILWFSPVRRMRELPGHPIAETGPAA
jgi:MFS family permease